METYKSIKHPQINAPFLEGNYYKYIRTFLTDHNFSLEVGPIKEMLQPREYDQSIMDLTSEEDLTDLQTSQIYC